MKKNGDPEDFVTLVEDKAIQCMEHICDGMPGACDHVVHPLRKRIDDGEADESTLEELKMDLKEEHSRICGASKSDEECTDEEDDKNNEEVGSCAGDFKGRCHHCGKWGHEAAQCRENPANKDKFQGKVKTNNEEPWHKNKQCHHCKEMGHVAKCCPN